MALRAAKADEDAAQGMWGQRLGAVRSTCGPRATTKTLVGQAPGPAAEPQLGAEFPVTSGGRKAEGGSGRSYEDKELPSVFRRSAN